MIAVVLAAGRGTRMGALTASLPKSLLPVAGRPLLWYILAGLQQAGVREVTLVTGHLGEAIERAFEDGSELGLRLTYRSQPTPDGTARGLLCARDTIGASPFLLSWGDIIVEPAVYARAVESFNDCDGVLSLNEVDDPWFGGAVYVDEAWRVQRIVEKPPPGTSTTRWNNSGILTLSPLALDYAERVPRSERGEYELPQALAAMVVDGRRLKAFPVRGYRGEFSTPDDLAAAAAPLSARRELWP